MSAHHHTPSRNQKQRSKLKQAPEVTPPAPEPEPKPEEEPRPVPAPPARQVFRFKRSGHAHQELIPPNETPRPEAEY